MKFGEAFIELHDLDGDQIQINVLQVAYVYQIKCAGRVITVIKMSTGDAIKVQEDYKTVTDTVARKIYNAFNAC